MAISNQYLYLIFQKIFKRQLHNYEIQSCLGKVSHPSTLQYCGQKRNPQFFTYYNKTNDVWECKDRVMAKAKKENKNNEIFSEF